MHALVECGLGVVLVDLDEEDVELTDASMTAFEPLRVELPLLVAADSSGSTVVAVVDRRPPLMVSGDGGLTWRESGGGLPPGRAVAVSPDHPDLVLYASESRLYLSRDGGRFWTALAVELPEIVGLAWIAEGDADG